MFLVEVWLESKPSNPLLTSFEDVHKFGPECYLLPTSDKDKDEHKVYLLMFETQWTLNAMQESSQYLMRRYDQWISKIRKKYENKWKTSDTGTHLHKATNAVSTRVFISLKIFWLPEMRRKYGNSWITGTRNNDFVCDNASINSALILLCFGIELLLRPWALVFPWRVLLNLVLLSLIYTHARKVLKVTLICGFNFKASKIPLSCYEVDNPKPYLNDTEEKRTCNEYFWEDKHYQHRKELEPKQVFKLLRIDTILLANDVETGTNQFCLLNLF